jgi:O-antigen/teichoic acid export membrane protein
LVQNLGIEIQKAKNMHQFRSLVYLFVAIGNFLLSIPMAKRYGGVGSAWGTAIALLIGNGAVMNWYYHRRVGLDMKYFWGQIVKIVPSLIPPILVGLALGKSLNTDKIEWFLVAGLSYTTAFVVSLWFFGMNEYERELLGGPVRRILVSLGIRRGGPIGRKRH